MNLKSKRRKKQGLGYFQLQERIRTDNIITSYLHDLERRTVRFNENLGYDQHACGSIRGIERATRLHHITIKKAMERLKKNHVMELQGKNRRRLFCLEDSPMAGYVRSRLRIAEDFAGVRKLNTKRVINGREGFHKTKRKGYEKRIYDKYFALPVEKQLEIDNRVRRASDRKRVMISIKNRKQSKFRTDLS